MTDKELDEFIYVGENKFIELAMIFGDAWASTAIQIAAEHRAMLTQPEPVAWINAEEIGYMHVSKLNGSTDWKTNLGLVPEENDIPLYTAPPKPTKLITVGNVLEQAGYVKKKEWVGLTQEETIDLLPVGDWVIEPTLIFAQRIEEKLKEKNT
jgi:hypothetical protein